MEINVSLKDLYSAVNHIKYYSVSDTDKTVITITLLEADVNEGRMCDILQLTTHETRKKYDSREQAITTNIEVFSETEKRSPKVSKTESEDLSG